MFEYSVKQGDTAPDLEVVLRDEAKRKGIDLEHADRVDFIMKLVGEQDQLFQRPVTIVNEKGGRVRYSWQAGDTDVPGLYDSEFLIVWETGAMQRVPNEEYFHVRIEPSL